MRQYLQHKIKTNYKPNFYLMHTLKIVLNVIGLIIGVLFVATGLGGGTDIQLGFGVLISLYAINNIF